MTVSIEDILARSQTSLCWETLDPMQLAARRGSLSKRIAAAYPAFEGLRDSLLEQRIMRPTALQRPLLATIEQFELAQLSDGRWRVPDNAARRYLTGGWLEEYVALAVAEAGADEVLTGQRVRWRVGECLGENEIDVLARFGSGLFLCSCKALKSALRPEDIRTRERLMNALHEADNLADHFAPDGGIVALAVTTDLVDERTRTARYQQLHGKAGALGVSLLSLEHLPWPNILKRLKSLVAAARPAA